jgi:hypothetical protein
MKLSEKLLNKLVDEPVTGRHLVAVSEEVPDGWAAGLTVDRTDVVGCVIWELTLQCRAAEAWDANALSERSHRIGESITGLLEPLKLVEVDSLRNEAIVRSDAPMQRGEELFYYEAKLQPHNTISLRRYRATHDTGKRQQVAFTLTHDAIGKLVDDLMA